MFDCGGTKQLVRLIGVAPTQLSAGEKSPRTLRAVSERQGK